MHINHRYENTSMILTYDMIYDINLFYLLYENLAFIITA